MKLKFYPQAKYFLTLIFIYTENQLIQNLPIESQCNTKEGELVKYVYATKMSRVKSSFIALREGKFIVNVYKFNLKAK